MTTFVIGDYRARNVFLPSSRFIFFFFGKKIENLSTFFFCLHVLQNLSATFQRCVSTHRKAAKHKSTCGSRWYICAHTCARSFSNDSRFSLFFFFCLFQDKIKKILIHSRISGWQLGRRHKMDTFRPCCRDSVGRHCNLSLRQRRRQRRESPRSKQAAHNRELY